MALIEVSINTDDWYKVERPGWVGLCGWAMLGVAVGIWPFRLFILHRIIGPAGLITSTMDLMVPCVVSVLALIVAVIMFSQPRMASAETDSNRVLVETGFTQVQETEIPFSEVSDVVTGIHPLFPLAKRVSLVTRDGKKVVLAWDMDSKTVGGIAAAIKAMIGGGDAAPDQPADDAASS